MNNSSDTLLFTSAALLDFLSSIDELSEYDIGIEFSGNNIQCKIGDSVYQIDSSDAEIVDVDEETVDEVNDITESAYEELDEDYNRTDQQPIQSGIIKEAIKTLLLGGMVRLSAKILRK